MIPCIACNAEQSNKGGRAARAGARDAQVDAFTPHAWFATLTNVSFDSSRFTALIAKSLKTRARAKALAEDYDGPDRRPRLSAAS